MLRSPNGGFCEGCSRVGGGAALGERGGHLLDVNPLLAVLYKMEASLPCDARDGRWLLAYCHRRYLPPGDGTWWDTGPAEEASGDGAGAGTG